MKTIPTGAFAVSVSLLALIASTSAATADLEMAIRSFPDVNCSRYRPDSAARCANVLIMAGEQAACDSLNTLANEKVDRSDPGKPGEHLSASLELNKKVCFLCRLLFVPRPGAEPLRPPKLGMMTDMPYESMDPEFWPDLPFVITNHIPLSMNLGYALGGVAESGKKYLAYCRSNGLFRAEVFAEPTWQSASNWLNQVFASGAWERLRWKDNGLGWQYDLNEQYTKRMLFKQVENMR
jgi:hypothetical protein